MRTIKHRVNTCPRVRQRQMHFVVDRAQRGDIEQAAPDARLVGGQHYMAAGLIETSDGFQAAGNRYPFVRVLDERRAVVIDHAVAVEDDEFHAASLARSATLFSR